MQQINKYCVWLTYESDLLNSIIFDLSNNYNGPVFQAHSTLLGKSDIPLINLKSAIIGISAELTIKEVTVENIEYRDDYWMAYFITIHEKQILLEIHQKLLKELNINNNEIYYPHISLLYGSLSTEEKNKIETPIQKGDIIKIRSIQITECGDEVEKWKPVFELKI